MLNKITLQTVLFSVVLAAFSCKKLDEKPDNDLTSSKSYILGQSYSFDIFSHVDGIGKTIIEKKGSYSTNAKISIENPNSFPRTVTVNYNGNEDRGVDGRIRNGKIIITYSSNYSSPNTICTVVLDEFSVDNALFSGDLEVITKGFSDLNNPVAKFYTIGLEIKIGDTSTITWEADELIEWTGGKSTPSITVDDVFAITGTSSGINLIGDGFTSEIISSLSRNSGCSWPSSGHVDIIPDNDFAFPRILNLGNGNCDSKVSVILALDEITLDLEKD